MAWRVPEAVAALRRQRLQKRAQKSGRPASAAQQVLCAWTVLVTNMPAEQLSLAEANEAGGRDNITAVVARFDVA